MCQTREEVRSESQLPKLEQRDFAREVDRGGIGSASFRLEAGRVLSVALEAMKGMASGPSLQLGASRAR